jgi:hypothetical protein
MGWFSDFISDPIGTIGETGQDIIDVVKENPLEAAALATAGYYFYPEISAWLNPATGEAVAGTAEGAAAGATKTALSGITAKGVLDTAKAGLLVNALTGDPLGLSDIGGGGSSAPPGFAQVPIPEDWTSPTYTYSPVQNVTFEDLFPGVSLQGTQWQNLPQAQTFNEMFAAGRQTPMGTPVDLNQIVSSILGQTTTS